MLSSLEAWGRYAYAKAVAATMLQALHHCQCEYEDVVEALEMAALWRIAISTTTNFTPDLLAQMMEATQDWNDGGQAQGSHSSVIL